MTTSYRPRRSALYLPASNARAIEKARTLDADVVILDLEDSVAPEMKAEARAQAVAAAKAGGFGDRELVIRINALDTHWGKEDLAAVAGIAPDAVLVPKVSAPGDTAAPAAQLGTTPIWAMIETCAALFRLEAIAGSGVQCLVMGVNDLAKEMRATLTPDRTPFLPALAMTVAAARGVGIAVLDGVSNEIENADALRFSCEQGSIFGFDGKTLIHPSQIDVCNTAFSPAPGAIVSAREIIAAFADPANAGKGAIRVDGRMVERLHLEEAERLVAIDAAIRARGAGTS